MGANPDSAIRPIANQSPQAIAEAWSLVREQAGFESGYEYSGRLSMKHGYVAFRAPNATQDDLRLLERLLSDAARKRYAEENLDPQDDDARPACNACHGRTTTGLRVWANITGVVNEASKGLLRGQVRKRQFVIDVPCPTCKGSGRRAFTPEERKAQREQEKKTAESLARLSLGPATLAQMAEIWDDKWGDAVAVVGKDAVWFGGYCAS